MPEEKEDKGFKVIDRRGREESPPSPPLKENPPSAATEGKAPENAGASPPKQPQEEFPQAGAKEGSPPHGAPVEGEKGRAGVPSSALGVPRFLDLVQSLQMGAMVGLGMFQGPDGKRPPVDLPAAKDAIDLLGILQEKTKGNLTKEEEEVLREGLYHLRMGYMAMINAPPAGRGKGGDQR
jgi:hypothetical protein